MLTALIGRVVIILFGVLHPSYKTYKAIKRKDYQEVVLGMYWVVFSIFTTVELVTDIFFNWLPFYYELKIAFVIWLISPATSGYSLIYRRLIHPELSKRESEIDDAIQKATEKGYTKVVEFGAKGLNYAAKTVLSTAMMGQDFLADRLRHRSASMVELNRRHYLQHPEDTTKDFGAGDGRDQNALYASDPHRRGHLEHGSASTQDDPFALSWLQTGSTGSLGRHWRPPPYTGLFDVPEDSERSTDGTEGPPKPSAPRRSSNIAQPVPAQPVRRVKTRKSVRTAPPAPASSGPHSTK
ncbi:unnamed protein product [Calicophoron daubneyi]|uniref:Receptor expression-enhancing protein n=1 Tax=Calicophoron daubneyi TaxID=300641 RepID=A0AAV2T8I9_CALDB